MLVRVSRACKGTLQIGSLEEGLIIRTWVQGTPRRWCSDRGLTPAEPSPLLGPKGKERKKLLEPRKGDVWSVTRKPERKEVLTPATTRMNLENVMQSDRSWTKGHMVCEPT